MLLRVVGSLKNLDLEVFLICQSSEEKTHFDLTRRLGVATAAVFEWETQHQLTPGTHFREREIKSRHVRGRETNRLFKSVTKVDLLFLPLHFVRYRMF